MDEALELKRKKARERKQKWRKKHPQKLKEQRQRHYQKHKENISKRKKEKRQENKEYILSRDRQYYTKNREKIIEQKKKYRILNPEVFKWSYLKGICELNDKYVKTKLREIGIYDPPNELIELKRTTIKLKRTLKTINHENSK